jgi:hypothetical protein
MTQPTGNLPNGVTQNGKAKSQKARLVKRAGQK